MQSHQTNCHFIGHCKMVRAVREQPAINPSLDDTLGGPYPCHLISSPNCSLIPWLFRFMCTLCERFDFRFWFIGTKWSLWALSTHARRWWLAGLYSGRPLKQSIFMAISSHSGRDPCVYHNHRPSSGKDRRAGEAIKDCFVVIDNHPAHPSS